MTGKTPPGAGDVCDRGGGGAGAGGEEGDAARGSGSEAGCSGRRGPGWVSGSRGGWRPKRAKEASYLRRVEGPPRCGRGRRPGRRGGPRLRDDPLGLASRRGPWPNRPWRRLGRPGEFPRSSEPLRAKGEKSREERVQRTALPRQRDRRDGRYGDRGLRKPTRAGADLPDPLVS